MNCYICNKLSNDENHCEYHRYELQPLCDFMSQLTGCTFYNQLPNPFMNIEPDHIYAIKGFIAGAKLYLDLIKIDNQWRLISTDKPYFDYAPLM